MVSSEHSEFLFSFFYSFICPHCRSLQWPPSLLLLSLRVTPCLTCCTIALVRSLISHSIVYIRSLLPHLIQIASYPSTTYSFACHIGSQNCNYIGIRSYVRTTTSICTRLNVNINIIAGTHNHAAPGQWSDALYLWPCLTGSVRYCRQSRCWLRGQAASSQ
jgi:hypothetical protein